MLVETHSGDQVCPVGTLKSAATVDVLLVGLDNLDDLIVNLPPEQLLSLTAVIKDGETSTLHKVPSACCED